VNFAEITTERLSASKNISVYPHLKKIKDKRRKLCPELAEGIKVSVVICVYLSAILTATGRFAKIRGGIVE